MQQERHRSPHDAMSEAAGSAGTSRSAPVRALVIDDNTDVADSLVMLMETLGAEVRVAYDGASGLQSAADLLPDVIFVDIRMPGMDGHETARLMRARFGGKAPTLIALTGLGQDRDRTLSLKAGFDAHLTKPVSADVLDELFRRIAEQKQPDRG